jgi:hypothetical protein
MAVSDEVRGEVIRSQQSRLVALRDQGEINDKTYLALQLELDRADASRGRATEA